MRCNKPTIFRGPLLWEPPQITMAQVICWPTKSVPTGPRVAWWSSSAASRCDFCCCSFFFCTSCRPQWSVAGPGDPMEYTNALTCSQKGWTVVTMGGSLLRLILHQSLLTIIIKHRSSQLDKHEIHNDEPIHEIHHSAFWWLIHPKLKNISANQPTIHLLIHLIWENRQNLKQTTSYISCLTTVIGFYPPLLPIINGYKPL